MELTLNSTKAQAYISVSDSYNIACYCTWAPGRAPFFLYPPLAVHQLLVDVIKSMVKLPTLLLMPQARGDTAKNWFEL